MNLHQICEPIQEELEEFEREFESTLRSDVLLIDQIAQYVTTRKGKRLRPILVLLTSKLNGSSATPETQRIRLCWKSLEAATIVELLHTAALIHDDVVDDSDLRRGAPTVNSVWQNKISVLVGDYLFSKSLRAMLKLEDRQAMEILSAAVIRMSQGELLQIELQKIPPWQKSHNYTMAEEDYFRLISDKTASLISAACQLGAVASEQGRQNLETMREFGENLGIAFQIKDDLLDFIGVESLLGKPIGKDIKGNKITLPLFHSLRNAKKTDSEAIIERLKSGDEKAAFPEIVTFVEHYGGIDYAMQKANYYAQRALAALEGYNDSPLKASLVGLVDFITTRER